MLPLQLKDAATADSSPMDGSGFQSSSTRLDEFELSAASTSAWLPAAPRTKRRGCPPLTDSKRTWPQLYSRSRRSLIPSRAELAARYRQASLFCASIHSRVSAESISSSQRYGSCTSVP